MKKILLLLSVILTIAGCQKGEGEKSVQLKDHIANVWVFPENSSYERLEMTSEGEYQLVGRRVDYEADSYTGEYKLEDNVVVLSDFGSINVKSITSNSLYITLVKDEGKEVQEVTLTLKEPGKMLPNKERHMAKIVDLSNIFYPEDIADIEYSGDKLYRYTKYYSQRDMFLASPVVKAVSKSSRVIEYCNFVYLDGKITFTEVLYDRYTEMAKGNVIYSDYVVLLDKEGRATELSYKSRGGGAVIKFEYTIDGYLSKVVLDENPIYIKLFYDLGNFIELEASLQGENVSMQFTGFNIENKGAYTLPFYNILGDLDAVVNELKVLGKVSRMLPDKSILTLDGDDSYQLKFAYDIDKYGFVTKFNIKEFYVDDSGMEYTESIFNWEYQYK